MDNTIKSEPPTEEEKILIQKAGRGASTREE